MGLATREAVIQRSSFPCRLRLPLDRPQWFGRPQSLGEKGLKRDFESPKSGGRVADSLVRFRGGPNGIRALVGHLGFEVSGTAVRSSIP